MTSDQWTYVTLDQLIEISHGFAFKGEYFHDEFPGDILLTPGNFAIGGGFKPDKLKYYRGPVPYDYVLSPGDLLVTMTDLSKESDTLGLPALVPEPPTGTVFLHNQRLGKVLVRPGVQLDKRYLYYLLCSSNYRNEILAGATGTTVKHTSPSRISKYAFHLPPYAEQRAIASILGALDDKIEHHRRMNTTLEAMTRAIFQSWFVDFDPVRAKAEGRETGLPAEIAALFPDKFVESGNVRRPSTWSQGQLTDLLVLQRGFDLPSSSRVEGPYPVVAASGPSGTHNAYAVKGPGVTTGRSGVLGKVFLVQDDFWPLNTSLWVKEFRISRPYHAYFLLQTLDFATYNAGSAVPTLNRNHVHNLPMALPPVELVEHFETHVGPLFQHIQSNERQILTLSVIRDTLLPKLVSGELRVPEVEEVIRANLVSSSV